MIVLLIVLLVLLSGACLGLFLLRRANIRNAADELREIQRENGTNRQVHCKLPDRDMTLLLREVNAILEKQQEDRILYLRKEQELRRQIANVSHDLRTPLTSILGYTELLADESVTPEEKTEFLQIIETRARVLQTLITSFYDLSRLEAGEFPLNPEPLNLYNLLCEVTAAFYKDFTDSGFHVDVQLDENLPPVNADKNAMTRVFANLIQNVLKHGQTGVFIRLCQQAGRVTATFSNNAPNMTNEQLLHVFDRFFTADEMRTGQDTGLGLTIAKQFVERMGYQISAQLENAVFQIEIRF